MIEYTVKELPKNMGDGQNTPNCDNETFSRRYELTLKPNQTMVGHIKPREHVFYGYEAVEELKKIQSNLFRIVLEDFDYAYGKVRTVRATTFKATCPFCGEKQVINNWGWKEYWNKQTNSVASSPSEAMIAQNEIAHSFDDARDYRESKHYVRVDRFEDSMGSGNQIKGNTLFVTFLAFIEGNGESLIVRAPWDANQIVPFCENASAPFEHPLIHRINENTVLFGTDSKTYKTLYGCRNCGETFFVIFEPAKADKESLDGFKLESYVPDRVAIEISRQHDWTQLTITDQTHDSTREYQWNHKTGDFCIDGQTLVFNEDVEITVQKIKGAAPTSFVKETTLINSGKRLDAKYIDWKNFYSRHFPDTIPQLLITTAKDRPAIQQSIENINSYGPVLKSRSLLDTLAELALANRFQGYPEEFFRKVWRKLGYENNTFAKLVRVFHEHKTLPVQFERSKVS